MTIDYLYLAKFDVILEKNTKAVEKQYIYTIKHHLELWKVQGYFRKLYWKVRSEIGSH